MGAMTQAQFTTSDAEAGQRRLYGRAELRADTMLVSSEGRYRCTILDLSLEGARIETDHELAVGDALWLKVSKLNLSYS